MSFDKDIAIIPKVVGGVLNPRAYGKQNSDRDIGRGGIMAKIIIDATKPVTLPSATRVILPEDMWESMKLEDYL